MLSIIEISLLSVDIDEEVMEIEGEVTFDNELSTAFAGVYDLDEEMFTNLEFEIEVTDYDKDEFKEAVVELANGFDESL